MVAKHAILLGGCISTGYSSGLESATILSQLLWYLTSVTYILQTELLFQCATHYILFWTSLLLRAFLVVYLVVLSAWGPVWVLGELIFTESGLDKQVYNLVIIFHVTPLNRLTLTRATSPFSSSLMNAPLSSSLMNASPDADLLALYVGMAWIGGEHLLGQNWCYPLEVSEMVTTLTAASLQTLGE